MKHLYLFKRSTKDLWRMGKKYYILQFIQTLSRTSITFIGFIYMSKIVQVISEQQMDVVFLYIIQYLIIFSILQLTTSLLEPITETEQELVVRKIMDMPYQKMLRLQYHYADSAEISERLSRIRIANMNQQSSLNIQHVRIPFIMDNFIRSVWSIVLLTPLLSSSSEKVASSWSWIGSSWVLSLFVLGVVLILFLQLKSSKKAQIFWKNLSEDTHLVNIKYNYEIDLMLDIETGKEIRLYQLEDQLAENQRKANKFVRKFMKESYENLTINSVMITIISQILSYLAYAVIGIRVLLGLLPIGYIIQLSSALSQLLVSLPNLIQQLAMVFSQPQALVDLYEFMDLPEEKEIGSLPIEKRLDNEYELSVQNLSFTYPDSDREVLKDLTVDFEVGRKYAIVGENGSGKTTFIKLLMRLYEPTKGEVFLNKIDAQKYKLAEYFQLFSVVFQDFRLLGLNLGQNIAVNQHYDADLAFEKLKEVGLGDFTESLPKGLETYLGKEFENTGVQFSGGQTQKVAMARALYKDSPVMILDEPTAALDPVAEFEIYQKFDEIVENRTAFYISHRLSSCRFCDEILVFDEGKIIQRGSHEELVGKPGKYYDLWHAQAQYYQ